MDVGFDPKRYPILVVDDERDNLDAFRFNFRKQFDLHTATSGAEALELLRTLDAAVIISDQRMPRLTGIDLLKQAAQLRPDAVGIILTAFTDVDVLIEAVNMGHVYRYITKPWDSRDMRAVLRQAVERFHLGRENSRLLEQLRHYAGYLDYQAHSAFDFGAIVGSSDALRVVLTRVEQVAPTSSTILLRGETGTGKEMVARAVHLNSERAERPFIAVNCAALPAELLESELFGHEKGAFTGAIAQRKGRFELADGGTLFLDEIGDLPKPTQVKLLRVLQEQAFERVGGSRTIKVDVRMIAATNRDLPAMIRSGEFREDLFYRLNVVCIELPPLRERREDIPLLVDVFLRRFASEAPVPVEGVSREAMDLLLKYDYPGNVRELENLMHRAVVLARGPLLSTADFPIHLGQLKGEGRDAPASFVDRVSEFERALIVDALARAGGVQTRAAALLGMSERHLRYKLKKYGIGS